MNLLTELNGYWEKLKTEPLTPSENAVFTSLLYYLNRNNRQQPFSVSNLQLSELSGVPIGSLHKMKTSLVEKGYIKKIDSGRWRKAPAYTLVDFESSHISSDISSYISSDISSDISSTSKKKKKKNNNNKYIPTRQEVKDYVESHLLKVDADAFFDHYNSLGWVNINGVPIRDWRSTVWNWHRRNDKAASSDIKKLERQNKRLQKSFDRDYKKNDWKNEESIYSDLFED